MTRCFLLVLLAFLTALPAAAQPRLLANVNDAPEPDPDAGIVPFAQLGDGRWVFSAMDAEHGRDPWVSDGTVGGTRRLADLAPGDPGAAVSLLGATSTHAYFFLSRSDAALDDLWATDGTSAGTRELVRGFDLLFGGARASAAGDLLFFFTPDETRQPSLWVSDGTPAGSRRLPLPLAPGGTQGNSQFGPPAFGGAFYTAGTGVGGAVEPWTSDGTPAGTRRLPFMAGLGQRLALDGGLLFFRYDAGEGVTGVHFSDGTAAGTVLRFEVDGRVEEVVESGGRIWFTTSVPELQGRSLWRTDGTSAEEVLPATAVRGVGDVEANGPRLFFVATEPQSSLGALWVADDAGARRLAPVIPQDVPANLGFDPFRPFADGVAWAVFYSDDHVELWASDGTVAGTGPVDEVCAERCLNGVRLVEALPTPQGELLFLINSRPGFEPSRGLVASDGTAAGTRTLIDPALGFSFAFPPLFVATPGGVVLVADDGVHGEELWVTDGTAAGTRLLSNLAPPLADGDASPRGLMPYDGGFVFAAEDADGWGVWTSGGSPASTARLTPLPSLVQLPPGEDDGPRPRLVAGGSYYLELKTSLFGVQLARVDLTSGELTLLDVFFSSGTGSGTAVAAGSRVLYERDELVVTDGTPAGTTPSFGSELFNSPRFLVTLDGDSALFAAGTVDSGVAQANSVWRSDGTLAGTELVYELEPGSDTVITALDAADGVAYFALTRRDGPSDRLAELWTTDGTVAGTRRVREFPRHPALPFSPQIPEIVLSGSTAFFVFNPGSSGLQDLWHSDGTRASTRPVLGQDGVNRAISELSPFAGGLLFAADEQLSGDEPWFSDGTTGGTRRLGDLVAGAGDSSPHAFAGGAGRAFFVAFDGERRRLWTTDGTADGTFPADGPSPPAEPREDLPEVLLLADRVIYTADGPAAGDELWFLPFAGLVPPGPPPPLEPPNAPDGLVGATSVRLSLGWNDRSDDEQYFSVEVRTPAQPLFTELTRVPANQGFANLDELPFGLPHAFRVRAVNAAGASPPSEVVRLVPREQPYEECTPSDDRLCLLGDRFLARLFWRDPRSGDSGQATAVPLAASDRSGTYWFFRPENVELIVKVLDGVGVNRRYWVFAGGLTDLERWLHVVDTESGDERVYFQQPGDLCGFGDTGAFAGGPLAVPPGAASRVTAALESAAAPLALLSDRFEITVDWRDPRSGDTGTGQAIPGSDNTGYFWFFNPANVELVVKVLDGRPVNGKLWFFYGGLSDVEYTVRVEDLVGGVEKSYHHAPGDLCGEADTRAFDP